MTATLTNTFTGTTVGYSFREGEESMKAGKYLVIDPCYFLGHDDPFWNDLCAFSFPENEKSRDTFTIEIEGHKVLVWGTAFGDGEYPTLDGGCIIGRSGVDAGVLSLVPVELLDVLPHLAPVDDQTAPTVEIKHDFEPFVEDGDCRFGGYRTLTGENEQECSKCGEFVEDRNWDGLCSYCEEQENTCDNCGRYGDMNEDGICSNCAEEDEEDE
jgi:hypothetical protein